MEDGAAVDDESGARERHQVLDVAVGADRRNRRLDVVDADAVVLEHLVVRVELRLEPPEVGVPGGATSSSTATPAAYSGRTSFSRRPRDEHLAQRPDPLGAPAAAPDLLDLVVEVGLVQHVVAKRLARLEPRQRLEQRTLVVRRGRPRRRIAQLDRLAVGSAHAKRDRLPIRRFPVRLDVDAHDSPLLDDVSFWQPAACSLPSSMSPQSGQTRCA